MLPRVPPTHVSDDLLDMLFAAIERGDIDAIDPLFADDIEVWHNTTNVALDKCGSLKLLSAWSKRVTEMHYEVLERRTYDGGAFQRHVIHGKANGTALQVPVCIVFHIAGDRITRIYEYLDGASVASVFAAQRD